MSVGETRDTIVAVASPPGPGRRGILRVSGTGARGLSEAVLGSAAQAIPGPGQRAWFEAQFFDGTGSQPVLVLWMGAPRSYTREDVVEFHLPGSPPLLQCALARLVALGARPAHRGEFTRRAFENGRIDLSRAEAICELVAAGTDSERRAAIELLGGGLSRRLVPLREALDGIRALLEASLDFDVEDTGHVPTEELLLGLDAATEGLDRALAFEVRRQAPTALPRVVLFGAPNAGKSSLFNALAGERALVSDEAGTTRDVLRALWRVGENDVLLVDTAGFAGLSGRKERLDALARERAESELESASLVLWVVDACRDPAAELGTERRLLPGGVPVLGLWSRIDRPGAREPNEAERSLLAASQAGPLEVSASRGLGLGALTRAVERALWDTGAEAGVARELFVRHREALAAARARVAEARAELLAGVALDLVAETLRGATAALDEIEGHTSSEDLLDRIFARFCLGK